MRSGEKVKTARALKVMESGMASLQYFSCYYAILRSLVTRPTSTHSTTKIFPAWSKQALCGQMNFPGGKVARSEERRVGKECRARRWQQEGKNNNERRYVF